ncbi:MAG: hypothetical protein ACXACA_04820 [Candidatus Ranarchaeia archaeon]
MSIQQLLTAKQELLHSIDQHEAYLKEKRVHQILLRQTEGFSLPFVEAIVIGFFTIWVSSLGILPPLFLIFSEPLLAFGLAAVLLIPINIFLSHWIRKNRQHALQRGKLVERASTYFQEKSKFWEDIFKQEAVNRSIPSKEEIVEIILDENPSILLESPLNILTIFGEENSMKIEETPISFDVYGKLLAIEYHAPNTNQQISRLFVSKPFVIKCNKGNTKSIKNLLPDHSDTLGLLREVTNSISQNNRSHVITSNGIIGIVFEDVIGPSKNNLEGYSMLPRLIDKVPNIFK